ncbi:hypothetical protein EV677_1490 [Herminiimonas fonticola]|uniref:Uncharacterized protein n=1 Tax=Herminiimonas fonticola TaxID=303380 RepID=A0A4R6GJ74_9BURK|nr:hypothetical protein Hfont_1452 [Herminiimonas fonticola]TDN94927.1 hypothetical protein EV677_1490 [Herminiimonas fonticola]
MKIACSHIRKYEGVFPRKVASPQFFINCRRPHLSISVFTMTAFERNLIYMRTIMKRAAADSMFLRS